MQPSDPFFPDRPAKDLDGEKARKKDRRPMSER